MAEPVLDWLMPCDVARWDPAMQRAYRTVGQAGDQLPAVLAELSRLARTGDPALVRLYATALVYARQPQRATRVLIDLAAARPDDPLPCVDLATAHFEAREPGDAAQALAAAAERSTERHTDRAIAEMVEHRVAQLRRWQDWSDAYRHHQVLRAAAMRERIEVGVSTMDDRRALGSSLLSLCRTSGVGDTAAELDEAIAVLEEAHALDPRHVPVLELLVLGNGLAGRVDAYHRALRDLERLAPHSRILDPAGGAGPARDAERTVLSEQYERIDMLTAKALKRDERAMAELRTLYRRHPTNRSYVCPLLIAEMVFGNWAEVRRRADELAAQPDLGHVEHFHLAQAYWFTSQRDLGRFHIDRAAASATSDDARRDVAELRARLEGEVPA
jgi:tetratricopeptide (TPR) repeat protein